MYIQQLLAVVHAVSQQMSLNLDITLLKLHGCYEEYSRQRRLNSKTQQFTVTY